MTRGEAAEVVDRLVAGYPRMKLLPATATAWVDAISASGATYTEAVTAAANWARTNDAFPSLAGFLTAVDRPTPWRPDPDRADVHPTVARRITALWRQALEDVDKRAATTGRGVDGHWHGGPDPCPICGGTRPNVKWRQTS